MIKKLNFDTSIALYILTFIVIFFSALSIAMRIKGTFTYIYLIIFKDKNELNQLFLIVSEAAGNEIKD